MPRAEGGGEGVRGGGRAVVPRRPPPVPWPGPPAAAGPGPGPPPTAGSVAPPPPPATCSAGAVWRPQGRARPDWPPVGQFGGGGGRCAALLRGRGWGAPGGGGLGVALPQSAPLPPSGWHQSGRQRRCPVLRGRGPLTSPSLVCVPRPGCSLRGALARPCRTTGLWRHRGGGRAADWGVRGVRAQWRPSPGAAALSGRKASP